MTYTKRYEPPVDPPDLTYQINYFIHLMETCIDVTTKFQKDHVASKRDMLAKEITSSIVVVNAGVMGNIRMVLNVWTSKGWYRDQKELVTLEGLLKEHCNACITVISLFIQDDPEGTLGSIMRTLTKIQNEKEDDDTDEHANN